MRPAGFIVLARDRPLNRGLIAWHVSSRYRYRVHKSLREPYALEIILRTGRRLTVA
jgi:hypothetical protein